MPDWEPSWNTYMARANGAPYSFVLDMAAIAHAPLETHPVRVQVRVALQRPRPDGLRDGAELEAMGNVEDAIVSRMERGLAALYVGRFVGEGHTTFVFYLPKPAGDAKAALDALQLAAAISEYGPYRPERLVAEDAAWSCYREFLYPDAISRERMLNRDQLRERENAGDRLDIPRTIDHFAYFPTSEGADAAGVALRGAGFAVDPAKAPSDAAEGRPARTKWGLEFHRTESLTGGRPDAFCAEIRALIEPHDGDYDGWGGVVAKGEA